MQNNKSMRKLLTDHRPSLLKHISKKQKNGDIYDKEKLKLLLKHLRLLKKEKSDGKQKEYCLRKETSEVRTDTQVKLRCHQLPNVVQELRKAILRQDWDETICCILFFNHFNSNLKLLQDFIRLITGYILQEDVNKFIKVLFALRKSAVTIPENRKCIRKTSGYKVTRDFEFESL